MRNREGALLHKKLYFIVQYIINIPNSLRIYRKAVKSLETTGL